MGGNAGSTFLGLLLEDRVSCETVKHPSSECRHKQEEERGRRKLSGAVCWDSWGSQEVRDDLLPGRKSSAIDHDLVALPDEIPARCWHAVHEDVPLACYLPCLLVGEHARQRNVLLDRKELSSVVHKPDGRELLSCHLGHAHRRFLLASKAGKSSQACRRRRSTGGPASPPRAGGDNAFLIKVGRRMDALVEEEACGGEEMGAGGDGGKCALLYEHVARGGRDRGKGGGEGGRRKREGEEEEEKEEGKEEERRMKIGGLLDRQAVDLAGREGQGKEEKTFMACEGWRSMLYLPTASA
eukprot:760353-Hanusia_phi.AAC.2